jgi:hypothetical protein
MYGNLTHTHTKGSISMTPSDTLFAIAIIFSAIGLSISFTDSESKPAWSYYLVALGFHILAILFVTVAHNIP